MNTKPTYLYNYNAKFLEGKKKSSSSRIFGQKKNCDYRNQNSLIINILQYFFFVFSSPRSSDLFSSVKRRKVAIYSLQVERMKVCTNEKKFTLPIIEKTLNKNFLVELQWCSKNGNAADALQKFFCSCVLHEMLMALV